MLPGMALQEIEISHDLLGGERELLFKAAAE
jgi:hypothetical protein